MYRYRATIRNTTGIAPYGENEIMYVAFSRDPIRLVAEVEHWLAMQLSPGERRPLIEWAYGGRGTDGYQPLDEFDPALSVEPDQIYDAIADDYGHGRAREVLTKMGYEVKESYDG